jgi:BRCA1 C Terminus (BRCT) domain
MTKVAVKLVHDAALSTATVDGLPPGQAHWWLRKGSDFVRLPQRIRGDQTLDLVVQLEPGSYILGVGPARGGVREDLEVAPPAAFPKGTVETPVTKTIDVKGKSIVITGDLDTLDRDAAKAWLVSLGAKVTSAVSGNTHYLLVGREPGAKKLEKAAELGTPIISEADLRASLGEVPAVVHVAAKPAKPKAPANKVKALVAKLGALDPKVEKFVGPSHFADLGMLDHELWGIAIGARGGYHNVHINLNDRPQWALKCSCRARNPCQHGLALLHTADRHFVPPVEPPHGHEEASRYVPGYE